MQCPNDKYFHPMMNICTDCTPGYYGPNCSKPCRYPGYGSWCQKECFCNMTICSHVSGCSEYDLDGHESTTSNNDIPMIIGLSLGFGIVLMIVAFFVITVANRKFYMGQIRENAHYVGSVVTEHSSTTNNLDRSPGPYTRYCGASEITDSSIYMLASSLR
ncbi:platelet endothelial aggregation receptor 1-like [Crassostrea angulata]|uniref:platelet endothelial aggregation receptor 1-like n=1 Tax=Magallana angulata TaxID=2784310 RepID=UPI00148A1FC6|nr:platelet endothelial aggregation receptor 1 [Crassostrea gigas]XP_052711143.1 platelet endothelial aggregation receptor 1-like [Crassostrea angulata]